MNIKRLFAAFLLVSVMTGSLFVTTAPVMANSGFDACSDVLGVADGSPICADRQQDGEKELQDTVLNVINVLLGVIGALAVIVIIISGLHFVISQGNADRIKTAKNALTYAIVGLAVSIMAYAIVNFVISAL